MEDNKNDSRKVLFIFLFMIGLTIILFGATYAFFRYTKEGNKKSSITLGKVTLHYEEGNGGISLTDALPMSETLGKQQNDYFEFTITSDTANFEIPYIITARKQGTEQTRIKDENIRIYLTRLENNTEVAKLYSKYSELPSISKNNHIEQELFRDTVPVNTSGYEKVFRLRMWVDENADFSPEKNPDGSYKTDTNGNYIYPMQNKIFAVTINVYTEVDATQQQCIASFTPTGTLQNAGSLTIGDEVSVGTENFIVVSSDANDTVLLAKYPMTIYDYATPIGSEDDLQFNGSNISGYNPNVPFSDDRYWDGTISDYSSNPIVYDPTKVTQPTYNNHTCIPIDQYADYFHDTLGIPYDDEEYQEYDKWNYNNNVFTYYQNQYPNTEIYNCAYYDNYKNPEGELPGYHAGRNYLTGDNTDYSVAFYVNRYKNKLETINNGININNARLLTLDEANLFINNNINLFDSNDYSYSGFWLANIGDNYDSYYNEHNYEIYYMDKYDNNAKFSYYGNYYAVRPVLEVPTCSINLD